MIHTIVFDAAADHQRGDARAGAEQIVDALCAAHAWWRDVVPLTTELVVGHDDQRVLALRSADNCLDQVDEVITAVRLAGVAGVFVLDAERLDETH